MESKLTVRLTTKNDLQAVDALLERSYARLLKPDYPPSVLVTALPLISRAQPNLLTSGRYFLAEKDGEVVAAGGYSWAAPTGGKSAGRAHIRHVVTDYRHTRQGIGAALMGRIFEAAQAEGAAIFHCISTRTAVPFYASLGFQGAEELLLELRPGITFPAIQMQKHV